MSSTGIYSSSKRSLENIAETLRLELSPFNVDVLSIVTGAIQTNCQTSFHYWKLPPDSLYKPIEGTIAQRARGEDGFSRMDPMQYARRVVGEIVRGKTGKFWYGSLASETWFSSMFLPTAMVVSSVVPCHGRALSKLGYGLTDWLISRMTLWSREQGWTSWQCRSCDVI